MRRYVVFLMLVMVTSLVFSQKTEWENLLPSAVRSEYNRMLVAYQAMDFHRVAEAMERLYQRAPSNAIVLWTYLFFAQNRDFGIESIEDGLEKNLVHYIQRVANAANPLEDFLLAYTANPRDRLVALIRMESQLRYVNWLVRLEIVREHVARNQDYVAAREKLSDLLKRYPAMPILYYQQLLLCFQQRDWESFDRNAQVALRRFPRHPEILRICGKAAAERGRINEAITYYERALQTTSSWHADGITEAILLHREVNQHARARSLLQRGRRLYPWKRELGVIEQQMRFGL